MIAAKVYLNPYNKKNSFIIMDAIEIMKKKKECLSEFNS